MVVATDERRRRGLIGDVAHELRTPIATLEEYLEGLLDGGLPRVQADPDRAVQVLSNLLSSALRYTPAPGCVELKVGACGQMVELSLHDSGVGISAENLPHVFERFIGSTDPAAARWAVLALA